MSRLGTGLDKLRKEIAGNRRLALGVAAIAAIVTVYAVLALADWRASLHERYVERRQYLRKVRSLAGQGAWEARAEQMRRLRKALEAEIPSAASPGLGQAMAQSWLRKQVEPYGPAVQVQTRPVEEVEGQPGLVRVPTVVSGALSPRSVVNLLRRIESNSTLTVVEQALILNRENQTFELTVVAYVRIGERDAVD